MKSFSMHRPKLTLLLFLLGVLVQQVICSSNDAVDTSNLKHPSFSEGVYLFEENLDDTIEKPPKKNYWTKLKGRFSKNESMSPEKELKKRQKASEKSLKREQKSAGEQVKKEQKAVKKELKRKRRAERPDEGCFSCVSLHYPSCYPYGGYSAPREEHTMEAITYSTEVPQMQSLPGTSSSFVAPEVPALSDTPYVSIVLPDETNTVSEALACLPETCGDCCPGDCDDCAGQLCSCCTGFCECCAAACEGCAGCFDVLG